MSDPNAPNAKNSLANAARYVHVHMTFSVPARGSAVYVFIPVVSQFLTTIDTNFSEECYCILLFKYSHSNVTFRTRPFYWNECLADLASKRVLYPSCLRQLVWQLWSFYSCKRLFSLCYRAVTDSINMLLNACMSAAPGQKECDNALRNIQVWTYCVVSKIISLPTFKVLWYQYPDTKKLERGGWSNS